MHYKVHLALSSSLLLVACASPRSKMPAIAKIYEQAALDEIRNPVVVIHGILGARLTDRQTGKIVWGAFTNEAYDPNTRVGTQALSLPLDVPRSAHEYMGPDKEERCYASGPLKALDVGLFFTVIPVKVYANILMTLGIGGYRDNVVVDPLSPAPPSHT